MWSLFKFFYQPFGCPKANFVPLTWRQLQLPYVNYNTVSSITQSSAGAFSLGWLPKPDQAHKWDSSKKPSNSDCNVLSHYVTLFERM